MATDQIKRKKAHLLFFPYGNFLRISSTYYYYLECMYIRTYIRSIKTCNNTYVHTYMYMCIMYIRMYVGRWYVYFCVFIVTKYNIQVLVRLFLLTSLAIFTTTPSLLGFLVGLIISSNLKS